MAIIYTYPQINSSSDLAASDLMIISDMSANGRPTKSLTLKNLADFITTTGTGTGTTNAIIKWTDGPSGLIGDSIMNEDVDKINLNGILRIAESNNRRLEIKYGSDSDTGHINNAPQNNQIIGRAGDLIIKNRARTKDILFQADDGQYDGNVTTYFRLDGSMADISNPDLYTRWGDNSRIVLGNTTNANNLDFEMYHDGSATYMKNGSFNLNIESKGGIYIENKSGGSGDIDIAQSVTNADVNITAYNGSYFKADTSAGATIFSKPVEVPLVPAVNANAASKQYVDQQIASIPAGLVFKGNWNASTNTPTLASGTGTVGNYYVVSVAGNTNLDGITDWEVGDWAVFVEVGGVDKWDKIDQTFVQGAGAVGQVSFWNGINSVTGDNAFFWDNSNKRLGIGTTSPLSKLHVRTANAGSFTYDTNADDLIVESNANGGITIATAAANTSRIIFASPDDATGSEILFNQASTLMKLGTTTANGILALQSGNGTEALRLNSSQNATFTGDVSLEDGKSLIFGANNDLIIQHNSGASLNQIDNNNGDLFIQQNAVDKDIIFRADDGSGGLAEYFKLDGSAVFTRFSKNARFSDNARAEFGDSGDLDIYHDGSNSFIANTTGVLTVSNTGGAVTLDAGGNDIVLKGSGSEFGRLTNSSQNFIIKNTNADKDIILQADDGSGGTTTYFKLDGSSTDIQYFKDLLLADNVKANFGNGDDLRIQHNGTDSFITNHTGDLKIIQNTDDKDIIFQSDDGSGGVTTYFQLDGSDVRTNVSKPFRFSDAIAVQFGTSFDMQIFHSGGEGTIQNLTGNLRLIQGQDNGDIQFFSDDGSGGTTEYFRLDGGDVRTRFSRNLRFSDNVRAEFGNSGDFDIYYDGSDAYLVNGGSSAGDIQIVNNTDDGDIKFFSDDGTGSTTEYFRLDGSAEDVVFSKDIHLQDNTNLRVGTGMDLNIFHNGTDSKIQNDNGDLYIINRSDDKDIIFQSDDGSGGVTEYFRLDGGTEQNVVSKNMRFEDSTQAQFGAGTDLRIYHDGSDSYIDETGTGDLYIKAVDDIWMQSGANIMGRFNAQGVKLYYLNVSKLETISSGAKLPGPGDGITLVSPDGNTTRKISIDNSGNLVVA